MRHVQGYIFLAYYDKTHIPMFGKKVDKSISGNYQNFESNGLMPYKTKKQAEKSRIEFEKERKIKTKTAKLEMKIAETEEELIKFEGEESLVVIMKVYDKYSKMDYTYGAIHENETLRSELPGARLKENKFKTICNERRSAFDQAGDLISEIARQGDSPATLATFKLELL